MKAILVERFLWNLNWRYIARSIFNVHSLNIIVSWNSGHQISMIDLMGRTLYMSFNGRLLVPYWKISHLCEIIHYKTRLRLTWWNQFPRRLVELSMLKDEFSQFASRYFIKGLIRIDKYYPSNQLNIWVTLLIHYYCNTNQMGVHKNYTFYSSRHLPLFLISSCPQKYLIFETLCKCQIKVKTKILLQLHHIS